MVSYGLVSCDLGGKKNSCYMLYRFKTKCANYPDIIPRDLERAAGLFRCCRCLPSLSMCVLICQAHACRQITWQRAFLSAQILTQLWAERQGPVNSWKRFDWPSRKRKHAYGWIFRTIFNRKCKLRLWTHTCVWHYPNVIANHAFASPFSFSCISAKLQIETQSPFAIALPMSYGLWPCHFEIEMENQPFATF